MTRLLSLKCSTLSPSLRVSRAVSSCKPAAVHFRAYNASVSSRQNRPMVALNSIPVNGPPAGDAPTSQEQSQITTALMTAMKQKIGDALETDKVVVQDMQGDGRHVSIDVVSPLFEGKTAVQRQRLVYKVSG